MSGLLTVLAHPDDESLACGGIIARCADAGVPVVLACVTRGEDAGRADTDRQRLATMRTQELHDAASVLGAGSVVLFDYPDGELQWLDAARQAQLETDIATVIRREHPEAVITFDEDGLYWHPDHIALHARTNAAIASLGPDAPALYYVSIPPGAMRAIVNDVSIDPSASGARAHILGIDDPDAFGALAPPPDVLVDVSRVASRKLAALRCHRSQIAGGALERIAEDQAPRLLGLEQLRRAPIGAAGPTFLDGMGH